MKTAILLAAIASACSPSGDVCTSVTVKMGNVDLEIATVEKYFSRYQLCVTGPKSKVCKTFPIAKSGNKPGDGYGSTVRWNRNFPNQGKGLYKVRWDASAKTLTFRR